MSFGDPWSWQPRGHLYMNCPGYVSRRQAQARAAHGEILCEASSRRRFAKAALG